MTRENDDENDDDADVSWFSTFDYRRIVITLGSTYSQSTCLSGCLAHMLLLPPAPSPNPPSLFPRSLLSCPFGCVWYLEFSVCARGARVARALLGQVRTHSYTHTHTLNYIYTYLVCIVRIMRTTILLLLIFNCGFVDGDLWLGFTVGFLSPLHHNVWDCTEFSSN